MLSHSCRKANALSVLLVAALIASTAFTGDAARRLQAPDWLDLEDGFKDLNLELQAIIFTDIDGEAMTPCPPTRSHGGLLPRSRVAASWVMRQRTVARCCQQRKGSCGLPFGKQAREGVSDAVRGNNSAWIRRCLSWRRVPLVREREAVVLWWTKSAVLPPFGLKHAFRSRVRAWESPPMH